ncbi:hypothetical protein BASA81_002390 [Batrachochytrium salamandrivorans]|nr:hypothetical protein BASA81_002390 [Batrachochytrium salamandrivorans]
MFGRPPSQQRRSAPTLYRTQDTHGYAVEFSPFRDGLLAVTSSQYFGIVGNGRQTILQIDPNTGVPQVVRVLETNDVLFDSSWSEMNEAQLVTCSGDGSIKLFDLNARDGFPIANWKEHGQETASVDWNLVSKSTFVSASWDKTCKLWDPVLGTRSVRTFAEHYGSVYNAQWSPRNPSAFVSCSGDGSFKIWDVNSPRSSLTVQAHTGEVLAVDWSKYNENIIVTGATDRTLRVWDLRKPYVAMHTLAGHEYAVRRLKCSPHNERQVLSCSYDMSVCLWDIFSDDSLLARCDHHTEFVLGIDWNLFRPNQVATCSWDEFVCVFDIAQGPPPRIPSVKPPQQRPPPLPLG